jgi:hypothetical protein
MRYCTVLIRVAPAVVRPASMQSLAGPSLKSPKAIRAATSGEALLVGGGLFGVVLTALIEAAFKASETITAGNICSAEL